MWYLTGLAVLALQGCEADKQCPSFATSFGRINDLKLQYFGRFRMTGRVSCFGGIARDGLVDYVPYDSDCPTPNSMDSYGLGAKIAEECLGHRLVDQSVERWLVTDWFGSPYIVRSFDRLLASAQDISVSCLLDNSTGIQFPSYWGYDLRTVAGNKMVELKPNMVSVTMEGGQESEKNLNGFVEVDLTEGRHIQVAAVLMPVGEFLEKVVDGLDKLIKFTTRRILGSMTLATDMGRSVVVNFFSVEEKSLSVVVVLEYGSNEPEQKPVASECSGCIEKSGLDLTCLRDTRNPCGLVVDERCEMEKDKMRMHCANVC
jgi:hypothetical protein